METTSADRKDNLSDDDDSLIIDSDDDSSPGNEYDDDNITNSSISKCSFEMQPKGTIDPHFLNMDEDLGINMENRNTQRKTDTDIRILIAYLRSLGEKRPPEVIPPVDLDRYLSNFFTIVKKHDGNEYEPASLRGMLCSVERYLKMKNYQSSVTRDIVFVNTRHALKFKQQRLREIGKGSKKPSEPFGKITLDKVNQLFSAREMGPYTPMSIINTLCFMFIVHFRLRKAIDHKNLTWGDIKLRSDQSGKEYLLLDSSSSSLESNNKCDVQNRPNISKLCIWAQPNEPERDPVGIYRIYSEKRPLNMKHENSPFYLGITTLHPSPMQAWYRTCAMGVNKLSDLVRMIRDITGLPRAALNAPAESLLSESYTATKVSNSQAKRIIPLPYHLPPSSSVVCPTSASMIQTKPMNSVFPKLQNISAPFTSLQGFVSASQGALQQMVGHNNSMTIKTEATTKELTTNENMANSIANSVYYKSRMASSVSGSSSSSSPEPSLVQDHSALTSLPPHEVKDTIMQLIQRVDSKFAEDMQSWLHGLKLTRKQETGRTECHQGTDTETKSLKRDEGENEKETNITLHIKLSSQAMKGQGPLTVTAVTNLQQPDQDSTKNNNSEVPDEQTLPVATRNDVISPVQSERIAEDEIVSCNSATNNDDERKRISESFLKEIDLRQPTEKAMTLRDDIEKRKRHISSQDAEPDAVANKVTKMATVSPTASIAPKQTPEGNPYPSVFSPDAVSNVGGLSSPLGSLLNAAHLSSNTPRFQHGPATSFNSDNAVIPQAHSSVPQRFSGSDARDLGFLLPVPFPYAGQSDLTNRMVQNSAMLASLTAPPMSVAHAGLLHQSLFHSIHSSNNESDIATSHNSKISAFGHSGNNTSNQQLT